MKRDHARRAVRYGSLLAAWLLMASAILLHRGYTYPPYADVVVAAAWVLACVPLVQGLALRWRRAWAIALSIASMIVFVVLMALPVWSRHSGLEMWNTLTGERAGGYHGHSWFAGGHRHVH